MKPLCSNIVANSPIHAHIIFMCHRIRLSVVYIYRLKNIINLVNKQHAIKMVNIDDEVQQ
jgi:hypothetical protein